MEKVRLLGARGITEELLQTLCSSLWSKRVATKLAIHGRHAAVFAVGASEAVGTVVGIKVGKDTYTAWPLCAAGHCPVLVVFRYNALCQNDGYFIEELDRFLDWVDLPYTTVGWKEDWFISCALPRLRVEAVKSGNRIADGVRTSYSLRVLERLARR